MLPDAAETVLGIFGFDRTLYDKARNTIWWDEVRKNRLRGVDAGTINE